MPKRNARRHKFSSLPYYPFGEDTGEWTLEAKVHRIERFEQKIGLILGRWSRACVSANLDHARHADRGRAADLGGGAGVDGMVSESLVGKAALLGCRDPLHARDPHG